jgi:hypothetical protein
MACPKVSCDDPPVMKEIKLQVYNEIDSILRKAYLKCICVMLGLLLSE